MAKRPKTRGAYDRKRVRFKCIGESRTKQSFKDEVNINNIINRFQETGIVTHLAAREGQYGFATAQTFDEAMQIVARASDEFEALPAKVRQHFNNDPAHFLDALQDPTRASELVDLGLLEGNLPGPTEKPAERLSEPLEANEPPEEAPKAAT